MAVCWVEIPISRNIDLIKQNEINLFENNVKCVMNKGFISQCICSEIRTLHETTAVNDTPTRCAICAHSVLMVVYRANRGVSSSRTDGPAVSKGFRFFLIH